MMHIRIQSGKHTIGLGIWKVKLYRSRLGLAFQRGCEPFVVAPSQLKSQFEEPAKYTTNNLELVPLYVVNKRLNRGER